MAKYQKKGPKLSSRDKAAEITAKLIAGLEKISQTGNRGRWSAPWNKHLGMARNGTSNRAYAGINTVILWLSSYQQGFSDLRWYTFNGVKAAAAARKKGTEPEEPTHSHVRKGSKGTVICFWSPIFKDEDDGKGGTQKVKKGMWLKTWSVFNHEQIEWADGEEPTLVANPLTLDERCAQVETALLGAGAKIITGSIAGYCDSTDRIVMPPRDAFETGESYVSTLAHEHVHWTGAQARLNRDLTGRYRSESYAAEELVAEMGAAFFLAQHGVESPGLDEAHMAYVASWIKVLKDDPYAIFTAARLAKEAVAVLTGESAEEDEEVQAA